jgi:hypothetical protein
MAGTVLYCFRHHGSGVNADILIGGLWQPPQAPSAVSSKKQNPYAQIFKASATAWSSVQVEPSVASEAISSAFNCSRSAAMSFS